ncbi:MAG: hypothetical protein K2X50_01725 [Gammaproteobacteria bacterium]|nr:hypothetical protein [Gammaproteobacteria bacterium]
MKAKSDTNINHIAIFLKWAAEAFRSAKNLHQTPIATTQANQENEAMSFTGAVLAHEKHITKKVESTSQKPNMFDNEQISPIFKKPGSKHKNINQQNFLKKERDLDNPESKNIFP